MVVKMCYCPVCDGIDFKDAYDIPFAMCSIYHKPMRYYSVTLPDDMTRYNRNLAPLKP